MGLPQPLVQLTRRYGLGRLFYRAYHAPLGALRKWRHEGPANLWLSRRGRLAMERAAGRLPAIGAEAGADAPEVHFLSGRQFWYQTAFCAYSLLRHSPVALRPVVYDDGTLDATCRERLRRVLPRVRVVGAEEIGERLDRALPAARFPALRARRLVYPHLRKLTDVHAGQAGWRLVLDSDMLFFRTPAFLLEWLRAPQAPCHMTDVACCYGYTAGFMERLAGATIPERLNVGVCGLRSEAVDWDRLEAWCRELIAAEGTHYLQEQALTAMLLAGRPCAVAPADDYIALPSQAETLAPRGVMHHYVAESKAWYFRHGWRHVLANTAARPEA